MPKGLKAIMVGAPVAPGIDVPMEGNVFWNFVYPWPFYTTNVKGLDDAAYSDGAARWKRLDHDWYVSGRPYRDLDKIDGTPIPSSVGGSPIRATISIGGARFRTSESSLPSTFR